MLEAPWEGGRVHVWRTWREMIWAALTQAAASLFAFAAFYAWNGRITAVLVFLLRNIKDKFITNIFR